MGLWKARLGELQLGWRSPVHGPVHPALVNLADEGGLGWLRGFDELLCRCGLESNGAPEYHANGTLRYGLHGRIANTPAHKVQVTVDGDTGEIAVVGIGRRDAAVRQQAAAGHDDRPRGWASRA